MRLSGQFESKERAIRLQSSPVPSGSLKCRILAVGKRRDGGTRYWCLRHKADATAKYGRRARRCRAAHLRRTKATVLELNADVYRGGIALWGAVPAVYDTTRLALDRGIHVHARRSPRDKKEIDGTYSTVRIVGTRVPGGDLEVSAIDAIYYMVSSVFGFDMSQVLCTHCGEAHLDQDWFSVHPHGRHLCASCGRTFKDTVRGVGNPICGLREACGNKVHKMRSANRSLSIRQSDFLGGIQVWGSNPALIWTSSASEEEGIHLHAFRKKGVVPDIDDTFSRLTIDGIRLDPLMVRTLMAQNTLPHLNGRVMSMRCGRCGTHAFSTGEAAYAPVSTHTCRKCGGSVRGRGRFRKTIANPLPEILAALANGAPRQPQTARLDLLPEMP